MNTSQKLIIVLLILAILFSASSIFISFSALNFDFDSIPRRTGVSGNVVNTGAGGVGLTVEAPPTEG